MGIAAVDFPGLRPASQLFAAHSLPLPTSFSPPQVSVLGAPSSLPERESYGVIIPLKSGGKKRIHGQALEMQQRARYEARPFPLRKELARGEGVG